MRKNLRLLLILVVLTLVSGVLWFLNEGVSTMDSKPLADFAISDTARVDKIYIVDTDQNVVTLTRDPNSRYWDLNGTYKARKDAVDLLLKTFKRIKVKSPVPEAAKENVIKLLAAGGKKVEIYQGGDEPVKTYIVGNATQDHTGTYMLLETADEGLSTEPFITHMEGFTGFLSTRFFTDVEEWRYTGVFDYPALQITELHVQDHDHPERSFKILYNGGNDISLYSDLLDRKIPVFDTLKVKDYLLLFKKVHVETYNSHLSAEQEDSLLNTAPFFTFSVLEQSGKKKKIDLYHKNHPTSLPRIPDGNGNLPLWDQARMYGIVSGGEVALCQSFVFDPLMRSISEFASSNRPSGAIPVN